MESKTNHEQIKRELAAIGLTYRGEEVEATPEEKLKGRYIKFNIPNPKTPDSLNGEGVWGLADREDVARYKDNGFFGKLTVILCNDPMYYCDVLRWGVEVVIRCNGASRPILDPEWVKEKLLNTGWEAKEGTP